MKKAMEKLETLLELGGTKKDIVFLILSGLALLVSIFRLLPLPFDAITLAIIGILVLAAGLYYLKAEKNDPESKKIYTAVSAVGAVIAGVCALLLFLWHPPKKRTGSPRGRCALPSPFPPCLPAA